MRRSVAKAVAIVAAGAGALVHRLSDGTERGPHYKLDERAARLRQVLVVFRHGARTPLTDRAHLWAGQVWDVCGEAYKAVPLDVRSSAGPGRPPCHEDAAMVATKLPGGCHKGQLTLVGQQQALDLGRWLRARYVDQLSFMPAQHEPGCLSARTTNFQRTIACARGVVTGLYPNQQQPVPITTTLVKEEVLCADARACPALADYMPHSKKALAEWAQDNPRRDSLIQRLCAALGLEPAFFRQERWPFCTIHDVMTCLATHGKPVPAAMTPELLHEVDRLATKEFTTFVAPSLRDEHGHAVIRLSMGRLLDMLVGNMDQAASATSATAATTTAASSSSGAAQQQPRMYMYSGHDSTLMPLLQALGQDVSTWPPYLSNLVFELWELPAASGSAPVHAVRVLYNREELPLPGSAPGKVVELGHFRSQVLGSFLLSEQDHARACRITPGHSGSVPLVNPMFAQQGSE